MEKPSIDKIDQIILMQPNNVTFGEYSYSEIQENLLTLTIDALQQHKQKTKLIQTDLWGQPTITVICDEAAGENNKKLVIKAVKDMVRKPFQFKWTHPNMGKTIETGGVVFTAWHDIKNTNKIELTLNIWAIPFLVYYGVGVGGTQFDKHLALSLGGEYTKRIYKMLCRWKDKPQWEYSIDELRKSLDIPISYDNNQIDRVVLNPAQVKIKECGSDVWFDYELSCKRPVKGRKPRADTVIFKTRTKKPLEIGGENYDRYTYVYRWLSDCWNPMQSSKAREIADKLNDLGELENVYNRCIYYDDLITSGKRDKKGEPMTSAKAINSIKKKLKEDYKLGV